MAVVVFFVAIAALGFGGERRGETIKVSKHITQTGGASVLLICINCEKIFKRLTGIQSHIAAVLMASESKQDKEKAPMIPDEDIGTEEGELVEQDPPRPEAVVRSDRDRKRKQIAVEEGPPAVALRPAPDNRTEAQRKHAIKDERYRQNSLFRHRWFQWFTQETANRIPIEQKFFTPGSKKGVANFRSQLMELAVEAFLKVKDNRNT
ncbi:hypothetical protein R1sor_010924 [Riccia sorocarpa]|uniref:C2H2-type domain-containing protein n=1 Tax=Riccia sorocarpa TaxID=122646 RepID=A0ABD3HZR9_9MARC